MQRNFLDSEGKWTHRQEQTSLCLFEFVLARRSHLFRFQTAVFKAVLPEVIGDEFVYEGFMLFMFLQRMCRWSTLKWIQMVCSKCLIHLLQTEIFLFSCRKVWPSSSSLSKLQWRLELFNLLWNIRTQRLTHRYSLTFQPVFSLIYSIILSPKPSQLQDEFIKTGLLPELEINMKNFL